MLVTPRDGALAALRVARYRRIWGANLVSTVGDWMQLTGRLLLIYALTGRTGDLGIIFFVSYAPQLFVTPFGGVFADRYDRRRTLLVGQVAQTLLAALIGGLALTHTANLANIAAVSLVSGVVQTLTLPASTALIPQLIPRELLPSAMSLSMTTNNAARIVGPLLAGVVAQTVGLPWIFLVNAASFLFVIVAWLVTPVEPPAAPVEHSTWQSMVDGFRYVVRRPPLLVPVVMLAVLSAIGLSYQVLNVAYAHQLAARVTHGLADADHVAKGYYSWLQAAIGAGGIVGVLALTRPGRRQPSATLFGTAAGFSASLLLLGVSTSIWVALPVIFLLGGLNFANSNLILTLAQHEAPEEMRGRVMSILLVAWIGLFPFTALLFGALGAHLGIRATFVLTGGVCLAATALLLRWRHAIGVPDAAAELRAPVPLAYASEEV